VINAVEAFADVGIQDILGFFIYRTEYCSNRIVHGAAMSHRMSWLPIALPFWLYPQFLSNACKLGPSIVGIPKGLLFFPQLTWFCVSNSLVG
jgi:hypothetical protein